MSLYDHKGGDRYFQPGSYRVRVKSSKLIHFNSGNDGREVWLTDGKREIKTSFVFTEKALWRIAVFAEACGMSDSEMRRYEAEDAALWKWLLGKELMIEVEKGEMRNGKRYSEVVGFDKVTDVLPIKAPQPPEPSDDDPVVTTLEGDDIPF